MTLKNVLQAAVVAAILSGCGGPAGGDADAPQTALRGAPAGSTVVTVNGEAITEPVLGVFARGRGLDPANPEQRQKAIDLLVDNVLLAQDAIASGVAAKPDVQAEVALVQLQQLAGRAMASYRAEVDVGDVALRTYYEQEAKRAGNVELHLQHILFADQASAQEAALEAAKPGADFEALMPEYAAKGAKQAKDLGFGNLSQYPKELADAAMTLKDGEVGPVALQTEFGWHVFKRAASRPFSPPPFEQVREGARKQLVDQALSDKAKALREQATIVPGASAG